MATLELTQVYLDPQQKQALAAKARAEGVKVSELIRDAVDTYLAGITGEELELLDSATRRAADDLAAMARRLDETNGKLDAAFAEIERLRKEAA